MVFEFDGYDSSDIDKLAVMIFEIFKFEPNHHKIHRNLTGPEGRWMTGLKTWLLIMIRIFCIIQSLQLFLSLSLFLYL